MARLIRETPVLKGRDAKRFRESMENVKSESEEVKKRVRQSSVTINSWGKGWN